ncbi:hypothetical protein [Xenorhabdus littoralis]|nr:hypothetical protein [Xenorhabdus sp. Reich]
MIRSLVRITFGQRQQHSCSLQGSTPPCGTSAPLWKQISSVLMAMKVS